MLIGKKKKTPKTPKNPERFLLRLRKRHICSFFPLFFSTVLEVLLSVIRQEREIKKHADENGRNISVHI